MKIPMALGALSRGCLRMSVLRIECPSPCLVVLDFELFGMIRLLGEFPGRHGGRRTVLFVLEPRNPQDTVRIHRGRISAVFLGQSFAQQLGVGLRTSYDLA